MLHGSGRAFGTDEAVSSDQEKYRRVYKNMAPLWKLLTKGRK